MTKIDNYVLDTEFFSQGFDKAGSTCSIEFISAGLVAMDGREFYGVSDQVVDEKYKGEWVYENVIKKLPPKEERRSLAFIRDGLLDLFKPADQVDVWAHNGSHDFFLLCGIFGGMGPFRDALKKKYGIRRVDFRDTKEIFIQAPKYFALPRQSEATEHIAICDARHEYLLLKQAMDEGVLRSDGVILRQRPRQLRA